MLSPRSISSPGVKTFLLCGGHAQQRPQADQCSSLRRPHRLVAATEHARHFGTIQTGKPELHHPPLLLRQLGQGAMHRAAALGVLREILETRPGVHYLVHDGQRMRAAGSTSGIEHDVVGDGEEPGPERRATVGRQRGQGAGEDETRRVFRLLAIAQPAIAVAIDSVDVAVIEETERLAIGEGSRDKHVIAPRLDSR